VTAPHVVHTWPLGWTVGSIGGDALTYVKKRATGGHAAGASGHASAGATVAPKPGVTAVEFFAHIDR